MMGPSSRSWKSRSAASEEWVLQKYAQWLQKHYATHIKNLISAAGSLCPWHSKW
jgi:hypothetical protein